VPKGVRVFEIASGFAHTCVITLLREVKCWGDEEWGQLSVPDGLGLHS